MELKEQAIANLKRFYWAAKQVELPFCLMDGTLLGAVRDGDFCPGDEDDLDVGVMDADYHIVDGLVGLLKPQGFEAYKPLILKGKVEGFGLKRGASHFDVIRVNHHPERPECYNVGRGPNGLMAFVYPSKHHEGFEEIEFYGMKLNVPADPEGFLTARYGDWRTEIRRPEFNWYEQSERSSIREDYDALS